MTVSSTSVRLAYVGNDATTAFPATGISVTSPGDYVVELQTGDLDPTIQILGVHYTVSGSFPGEGTINFFSAPTSTQKVYIRRHTPSVQETKLEEAGRLKAKVLEAALDKLQREIQEIREQLLLVPKIPYHEAAPGTDPGTRLPKARNEQMLVGADEYGWYGVDIVTKMTSLGFVVGGGGGGGGGVTWPLWAPAGTASAPSYAWASDQDTGLYYDAGAQVLTKDGQRIASFASIVRLGMAGRSTGLLEVDAADRTDDSRLGLSLTSSGGPAPVAALAADGPANLSVGIAAKGAGRVLIGGNTAAGIDITAAPYYADWTGGSDLGAAIAAAIADGHRIIRVPPGDYLWQTAVQAPPRVRIVGAGRQRTKVTTTTTGPFLTFEANADSAFDTDWSKGGIEGFDFRPQGGGILIAGHEVVARDLEFHGGVAGEWAIDLLNANECTIEHVFIGKGGSSLDWLGNGIRWRLDRGTPLGAAVNFGDGALRDVHIKLKSANSIGILLDASGFTPSSGTNKPLINNVLVEGVTVNSGNKPAGSIGIYLRQVSRCTFANVDVEFLDVGWKLRSAYVNGNSGSNQYNTFVGCYTLNCNSEWLDVGDTEDGGAQPAGGLRNHFIGCFFVGPAGNVAAPDYGFQNNDENGNFTARRSPVDLIFGGTTWWTLPSNGQVASGIRNSQQGRLLAIGDINYSPSPGSAPYDGMPKNDKPRKAIGFDFGVNEVRIFKPWGTAEGTDARLAIGNGFAAGLSGAGTPPTPLHHIKLCDPVYFERWPASTPLPSGGSIPGYGTNVADIVLNASDLTPLGTVQDWQGPGLYSKTVEGGGFRWLRLAPRPGFMKAHLARSGTAYALDLDMAGQFTEFTASSGDATITIPADLIPAEAATNATGRYTSFWAKIKNRSGAGNNVTLSPGNGVTMYGPSGTGSISSYILNPGAAVTIIYTRTGAGAARVDIMA